MPEFSCACRQNDWIVNQVSVVGGRIRCQQCDTCIVFTLETIEYTA